MELSDRKKKLMEENENLPDNPNRKESSPKNLKSFFKTHILLKSSKEQQPESYIKKTEYYFGKTLGAGSFGIVRTARHIPTNESVAIKILLKDALSKENLAMLYDELNILKRLHHKNIIAFKDWFESNEKFYIVTQLAVGGELFERIISKGNFAEADAVVISRQMLSAIQYIHSQHIVHRDLKPENILYLYKADDTTVSKENKDNIVIADFGISKELSNDDQLIFKSAGSMGYVAPEVLTKEGHGYPCDIWSLGVIVYSMLCGYSPFISESVDGFLEEISVGEYPVQFHKPYWNNISQEAKTFILKCCTVDPKKRKTADDLLKNDPWITKSNKNTIDLLPDIKKSLDHRRKLQRAIHAVILNNKIKKLKEKYNFNSASEDDLICDNNESAETDNIMEKIRKEINDISLSNNENAEKLKSEVRQKAFASIVQLAKLQKEELEKEGNQEP